MPNVEERLAYLERRVTEHTHSMIGIRDAIRHLEERMDRRFESVDLRLDQMDRRLSVLDEKISRQFVWLVGIVVTALIAIVTAFVAKP